MVEYTEREADQAKQIIEGLLSEERPSFDLQKELSIFDIEQDAVEFRDDLEIVSMVGGKFPALRVSDHGSVPVSLSLLGFGLFPLGPRPFHYSPIRASGGYFREIAYEYYYSILRGRAEPFDGFERISPEEARSSFIHRATDFLATRISGIRGLKNGKKPPSSKVNLLNIFQRPGGPRITTPGCSFSVTSNSVGLRVFWSGAYRISPNNFGHPTSPVVSVLLSGTYIFGVDGGAYGNVIQWDTSAVCSLPGKPSVHLNY